MKTRDVILSLFAATVLTSCASHRSSTDLVTVDVDGPNAVAQATAGKNTRVFVSIHCGSKSSTAIGAKSSGIVTISDGKSELREIRAEADSALRIALGAENAGSTGWQMLKGLVGDKSAAPQNGAAISKDQIIGKIFGGDDLSTVCETTSDGVGKPDRSAIKMNLTSFANSSDAQLAIGK